MKARDVVKRVFPVAAVFVVTAVFVATAALGAPVAAAGQDGQCADPTGRYTGGVPWGQRVLDPARIWPLTQGAGQVVAVLGAGVDGSNGQFADGQVLSTKDVSDCDGRATIAAGIVGAQKNSSTTFAGMAPAAHILPVRSSADPGGLAAAIDTAAQAKAGVILVAVTANSDSSALSAAVANARERGSVVIAPASAAQDGTRSYPAATPGVLAVGSTNQNGEPVQKESGEYLAIAAPGADLVSTSAGSGGAVAHRFPVTDPSIAAAYVAGAAALVRAYHPELTADQVVTRLTLTANRPPGGTHDSRLGWGLLDAYDAVSAQLPADAAAPGGLAKSSGGAPGAIKPAQPAGRPVTDTLAGFLALSGVGVAAAAGIVVTAVRRGRGRRWRPSRKPG